ncbi:ABC transporter ATP-binding protein [Telmatospirillum sp.]|uniref:ABC transporter ATP-binding protein n=1 Tax=Telmatospirillum sp. TaxID=2079197 RepID=UPI00284764D7|nr:ABC transporter ATP-binding protein [Telmatospirillum sp.]MDR3439374.1 ABC transporter ATP-binding protein [Telmatospirillum sp.]
MIAVELSGTGKCYDRRWAVRDVSLNLAAGERLALLGHNGAGKTTLMKLILGLIRPDQGHIRIFGEIPGQGTRTGKTAIGFLPENVSFHDAMTGHETLRFYARLKRRPVRECNTLLERVGLADAAGRRVATYSKGMRQRLGLAQALLGNPRLLLLDEPTTGLDPALRQSFYDILGDLAGQGTAVLLSSHLLTELEERTDRAAVMHQGRLLAIGSLAELRHQVGLAVEFHLTLADGAAANVTDRFSGFSPRPAGDNRLGLSCRPEDKMTVLRGIGALGTAIRDVELVEPGLNAVYGALTGGPMTVMVAP